jgi:uncharacterized protein (DUF2141 family)
MKSLLLFIVILGSLAPPANPKLTIKISNIEKMKGSIIVGVFSGESTFLKEGAAFKNYTITVNKEVATLTITDLPKGEYAISMYHDENSDKKMNTNFIGIPKEAYGFSNNIIPRLSAPKYTDCKFNFSEDKTLQIKLIK